MLIHWDKAGNLFFSHFFFTMAVQARWGDVGGQRWDMYPRDSFNWPREKCIEHIWLKKESICEKKIIPGPYPKNKRNYYHPLQCLSEVKKNIVDTTRNKSIHKFTRLVLTKKKLYNLLAACFYFAFFLVIIFIIGRITFFLLLNFIWSGSDQFEQIGLKFYCWHIAIMPFVSLLFQFFQETNSSRVEPNRERKKLTLHFIFEQIGSKNFFVAKNFWTSNHMTNI